jgi:hypothetical protein
LIFKVEPVLDKLKKKSETVGARPSTTRSEQRRRPCRPRLDRGRRRFAMPTASLPSPLRPQLTPPLPTTSTGYKRSTPHGATLFPPPPLRLHCIVVLGIIEPPQTATPVPLQTPQHRPELRTKTVNSLDPLIGTLGCSSDCSPARTHRPSTSMPPTSLLSLPSPLEPQRSPRRRVLLLGRCPHDHRSPAGRILPASCQCR